MFYVIGFIIMFLPVVLLYPTKVLHKGFLTLNNLPIIQYAINACKEIGVKEIIFIYSDQSCKHLFEKG
jgi:UTP-glucose-1-phosphate uridylyltransferase